MEKEVSNKDEISLKDILLVIKSYFFEICRKWWVIALLSIPFAAYFGYKAYSTPVKYSAQLRYVVEGSGDSGGGLGSLLGSFGLGGSTGGVINPHKVLEVTKSITIMDQVLLDTSSYNQELVINNIISEYKLDELWSKNNPELAGFRFEKSDINEFDEFERSRFKSVVGKVLGSARNRSEALLVTSLNDEYGIFSINSTTVNESLSLDLCTKTYDYLKRFFEEGLLENQKITRDILELKRDSLKSVIFAKSNQLARMQDRSRGAVSKIINAEEMQISNEVSGLSVAYQEAYKRFELADYSYRNNKPYFVTIDLPFTPLSRSAQSLIISLIIGVILAVFVGSILIVLRKVIKDAFD